MRLLAEAPPGSSPVSGKIEHHRGRNGVQPDEVDETTVEGEDVMTVDMTAGNETV